MITWRTSRLLLFFFLLLLSVLAIAASTMVKDSTIANWRRQLARVEASIRPGSTPVPQPVAGRGQAAELPHYPPVCYSNCYARF